MVLIIIYIYTIIYTMKKVQMSITIDERLAKFLCYYQSKNKISTKSEVINHALEALRSKQLTKDYMESIVKEENNPEETILWDSAIEDGLDPNETWQHLLS